MVLVLFAAAIVTASSWTGATPLYTIRMEQASSEKHFLPTEKSNFIYTTENGYTLLNGAGYGSAYVPAIETVGNTCWDSCDGTCEITCWETCDYTCPVTCGNTCPNTCPNTCQNTCPNTCSTCQLTCPYTCQDTCYGRTCWDTCPPCPP